jgi:hypothetical protein
MQAVQVLPLEGVNRRRLLQIFAASVPVALAPEWISAQVKARFEPGTAVCTELTAKGEVTSAWYERGNNKIQMRPNKEGARFQLLFTENDKSFLTATSEILRKAEDQALGRATLDVIAKGIQYKVDFDASAVLLKGGVPPTGLAKVQTSYNGKNWSSAFDYGTWHPVGGESVPHLDSILPQEIRAIAEPFLLVLDYIETEVRKVSGRLFAPSDAGTDGKPPAPSWGGRICRAACWGVAAGVGVTCCVGSHGIACALCAGTLAGGGQLCADLCPA